MNAINRNEKGFSFIEILVVLAILSILAALSLPQYERFVMRSKRADAYLMLKTIYNAELMYYGAHDHFLTQDYMGIPGIQNTKFALKGLGLNFINETSTGYIINIRDCANFCENGVRGLGYAVDMRANLDSDSTEDYLYIKDNMLGSWNILYTGNDGQINILEDDITG